MGSGRSDEAALMGVALAGIVTLVIAPGPFGWLSSVVGFTLLSILVAYDPLWHREVEVNRLPTLRQVLRLRSQTYVKHVAFGAVYVLCLFITFGILLNYFYESYYPPPERPNDAFALNAADIVCRDFGNVTYRYRCVQEPFLEAFGLESKVYFFGWLAFTFVASFIRFRLDRRRLRFLRVEARRRSRKRHGSARRR